MILPLIILFAIFSVNMGNMLSVFSGYQDEDVQSPKAKYNLRHERRQKWHRRESFEDEESQDEDDEEVDYRRFSGSHGKQHDKGVRTVYRYQEFPYQYPHHEMPTPRKKGAGYVPRMSNGHSNIYSNEGSARKRGSPGHVFSILSSVKKRKSDVSLFGDSSRSPRSRRREDILDRMNDLIRDDPPPAGGRGNSTGGVWLTPAVRSKIHHLDVFHDEEMDESVKKVLLLSCCEISFRAVIRYILQCFYSDEELVDLKMKTVMNEQEFVQLLNIVYDTEADEWDVRPWNTTKNTVRECIIQCESIARQRLLKKKRALQKAAEKNIRLI